MLADLVATQEETLERQSEECQQAKLQMETQQVMLEEAQRRLREAIDQKQKTTELNDMDL